MLDQRGELIGQVRFLARPTLHKLLCRLEDAAAVANDLVSSGTAGGPVTIRELSMAEVGVYNPAEYRDGARALAIEWSEKVSGDIAIEIGGMSAEERERALSGEINFSVNAGLVYGMWSETRGARWMKTRVGTWGNYAPHSDWVGENMGDLRRV